jgi:hypothetical protein
MRFLLFTCLLFALPAPSHGAEPAQPSPAEAEIAACSRHLQALGKALAAYRRDRGEYPDHLSDLLSRYVTDRALLRCPADRTSGTPGYRGAASEPGLACSYSYEMSTDPAGVHCYRLGPRPAGRSWRAQKEAQQVNFGERVPLLRCGHHQVTVARRARPVLLNLSMAGELYRSSARWELAPETLPAVLSCLERDLDQGAATFRRHWEPKQLDEYFRTVRPAPAHRDRCRKVAARLATQVFDAPFESASALARAVENLYQGAGDTERAELWHRRWTGGLLAPVSFQA